VAAQESAAADELTRTKATETLSQFLARVFNQLSLAAWLPSAALVLGTALVIRLGAVLSEDEKVTGWAATTAALADLADISVGGGLLIFAAVVVLTTLTQAFSFEAIRFLEGYWGTSRIAERAADIRAAHFGSKSDMLRERYADLTERAWQRSRIAIENEQHRALKAGAADHEVLTWSQDQLAYLGAKLRKKDVAIKLNGRERLSALQIPWEYYAPPNLLRRRVSVDKRLRDFPRARRCLPTRLGNVLRAHEDQTGRVDVETIVLEIYDDLPLGARTRHDEHRNRLDLYASMLFVDILLTGLAVARFLPIGRPGFAGGALAVGIVSMILTYRAAIASARVYGILLVDLAKRGQGAQVAVSPGESG